MSVNLKGVMWCLKHELQRMSEGGSIGKFLRPKQMTYQSRDHG
jgi:hypothetical protein